MKSKLVLPIERISDQNCTQNLPVGGTSKSGGVGCLKARSHCDGNGIPLFIILVSSICLHKWVLLQQKEVFIF